MLTGLFLLGLGCSANDVTLGSFELSVTDDGQGVSVLRNGRELLDLQQVAFGQGSADISFAVGSYLFENDSRSFSPVAAIDVTRRTDEVVLLAELQDGGGDVVGSLEAWLVGADMLALRMLPVDGLSVDGNPINRARARIGCGEGGPFLGAGGHQLDVDHQGEAFSLWTSEPGIGKVETDDPPDDWFVTGTRHATSFPAPFLLRPELPMGLGIDTVSRVDLDLCATDPSVWTVTTWEPGLELYLFAGDSALEVVEKNVQASGGVLIPPDWAFGPWNDAVHGAERVLEVATTLREAGAPTSLIWTEDWKGGSDNGFGYHLSLDWFLDETLYPDAQGIADTLADQGFAWLAYFSPFVGQDTVAWDQTADDLLLETEDGQPYTFTSAAFEPTGALDLSDPDARSWAQDRMTDLLDIGFRGWMADFAEWLPPDAVMEQADAVDDHNQLPLMWQLTNAELLTQHDTVWFTRSGWTGSGALSPVTWGGDQRTSFDTDDGFPTVIPLGIGLGISGVPFYGHDIAGYNSVGNPPSDKELWFRWAWLGAFTPIMRTHHGAYADDNHQFDTDDETLAHWVRTATEHSRLFPYLSGLALQAAQTGRPAVLHPALVYDGYAWDRIDAWLLGSALFVAPVLEQGAVGRDVELPGGTWYDWWSGERVSSGWFDADIDEIPVFAAGGTIVPMLVDAPDTFIDDAADDLRTLDDVDDQRILRVFGSGGSFTEADGTTYTVTGSSSGPATATQTLSSGTISVGGLQVEISGTVQRSYTVDVAG